MHALKLQFLAVVLGSHFAAFSFAADSLLPQLKAYETSDGWRQPVEPFALADNSWYIGTAGLSAVLIKTTDGAVLIDGGLPQAADLLLQRMAELDIQPGDLKWILHSHAHIDHSGPLAAVKRATGARLVSNAESALLLARGGSDDIHFGEALNFAPVSVDRVVLDGEVVALGTARFTAHFTPGHTPGSMSWTWHDRRDGKPVQIAYVDSLSTPGYKLTDNARYPRIVEDFRRSFATVRKLPCDLLITPHPEVSGWAPSVTKAPHAKPMSCVEYADIAETKFEVELKRQRAAAR